jgi:hypothetical protein
MSLYNAIINEDIEKIKELYKTDQQSLRDRLDQDQWEEQKIGPLQIAVMHGLPESFNTLIELAKARQGLRSSPLGVPT